MAAHPGGRRRLRGVLVAAQVALALVLLAGAGLAARSFDRLARVDPGFRTAASLTFEITLPEATYPSLASQTQLLPRLRRADPGRAGHCRRRRGQLRPVDALRHSAAASRFTTGPRPPTKATRRCARRTPGLHGDAGDSAARRPLHRCARHARARARVALISEAAARRFWPGENPVGKRLRVHVNETIKTPREIVGVVGDVAHARNGARAGAR